MNYSLSICHDNLIICRNSSHNFWIRVTELGLNWLGFEGKLCLILSWNLENNDEGPEEKKLKSV
jgi:hypothetical protein